MDEANLGEGVRIAENATVGVDYADGSESPIIGKNGTIRTGTIVYNDVSIGKDLETGHHALIREQTFLGDEVLVGTQAVIDGATEIGDHVSIQTGVYIPRDTTIGDCVFLGPNATLLNDMYPVRADYDLNGPVVSNHVSVGANATVLPDVTLNEGAFIAAGAVVTKDVPPWTLAIGSPAEHHSLPDYLNTENNL